MTTLELGKTAYEKLVKVVSEINAGVFVPAGATNVVVKNSYFDNNYEGIFAIKASNVTVQNNLVTSNNYVFTFPQEKTPIARVFYNTQKTKDREKRGIYITSTQETSSPE